MTTWVAGKGMKGVTGPTKELHTGRAMKFIASFAADVDLTTDANGIGVSAPRMIQIVGAGSGALSVQDASGNISDLTGLPAGFILTCAIGKIFATAGARTTNIGSCIVYW